MNQHEPNKWTKMNKNDQQLIKMRQIYFEIYFEKQNEQETRWTQINSNKPKWAKMSQMDENEPKETLSFLTS